MISMPRVFLIVCVALCGLSPVVRAEMVNGIRAVVYDAVITQGEVEADAMLVAGELQRQFRRQPELFDKKINEALAEGLENALERQLILRDYVASGYQMPESIIDEVVKERIQNEFGGDRARLTKTLQAQGKTYEQFKKQTRDRFIISQLRAKNIYQELIISPNKLEAYYLNHPDEFKVEDQVKLRMIVLNKATEAEAETKRALAGEISSKIKQGAAFAEMATVYSDGSKRNEGGDWGWVERRVLRTELAEPAFALKPGELSEVIETPEAIYLMLVEDNRRAHRKPLAEVRNEIERLLMTEEQNRLRKQYIDRLKKKTYVRSFWGEP
jgi:parvulin-like peptidyl-prolyl isomerase